MQSKTNEQALEAAIEKALAGYSTEEMKEGLLGAHEPDAAYGGNGYLIGQSNDFNPKYALDEVRLWHFLENTQAEELEKLKKNSDWKIKILERYDRIVKKYGVLRVLRKGLDVENAHFTLLYQVPMASSSQAVKDNFLKNEFSVTRQVRYNLDKKGEEIDMVVFINGIAIATLELKNAWTGQTAKVNGIKQYKKDRDVRQPLLNFGRAIVHFAVDTDEVYMTTKLAGDSTFFLPFNKGNNFGKGNPPNPFGHKTEYLWREVFTKESLANIIHHFVRFDGKPTDPLQKRNLFFPRYHQLDVVRRLLSHVATNGVGHTYLIQHSAGSGKSNSITWAAYQLIETYPLNASLPGAKDINEPIFDSVIVVTDKRLLDKQIRDNIKEFSQVKNIVAPAFTSRDLRDGLEQGKKIIITTVQKFPHIVYGIADMSNKNFAIIIDEAHSSQSGISAAKLNEALGIKPLDDAKAAKDESYEAKILRAMRSRKMKSNASYFAFTATPKQSTLERFGIKQADGSFKPFHLYSMKQAIEEGFILDVIANYTTFKSYYEVSKSIEDNPLFDKIKAQKKLKALVEKDARTIATKAEIMLDHFMSNVVNTKKLKGKAKGMVVTQSIESAIKYYLALKKLIANNGSPFKILVAFSDKKTIDGIEYTEADLNGFAEKETRIKFDNDDYKLLVVANKYLTGFDQPKLCAMYVDKKLQDVLAVQALSRLNRSANSLGKKTEDLFILDFFNSTDDMKRSFDPFYTSTTLSNETDVNVLHDVKESLDFVGVYEFSEIDQFNEKYFNGEDAQFLSPIIDVAANRFNQELELKDEEKADFKIKAKQFVKVYAQVAAIISIEMIEWEKLFWFLKFLIPKLVVKTKEDDLVDSILESVDLATYGLERTKLNFKIGLDDSESELEAPSANPRGAGGRDEKDALDAIIERFNERFFHDWDATPEDQRIKFMSLSKKIQAHPDYQPKVAKNLDKQNSDLALKRIIDDVMRQQRKQELDLYKLYAKDSAFNQAFFDTMKRLTGVENLK